MSGKYSLEDVRQFLLHRNVDGYCMSVQYNCKKLQFFCGSGHMFESSFHELLKRIHWCPICFEWQVKNNCSLNKMQQIAHENNGACLSDEFLDNNEKLIFKCFKCNHVWHALPNNIKRDRWCPVCAGG